MQSSSGFDNSTLAWVKDEIDLALEKAGEALARHTAAPDEAKPLAEARGHLHQACGALTIVGLAGITHVAETIEARLAALGATGGQGSVAVAAAAGVALAALRRYLDELMAGNPDQPLRLYAPYRALLLAAGLPEPAPLALFHPDLTQRPPRREEAAAPLAPARARALRLGCARGLAKWRAGAARGLTEMRNAVAQLEQSCGQPAERALWWVALAWFDLPARSATEDALLGALDRQFETLAQGRAITLPPAELMTGMLYDIARAPAGDTLRESVRAAYRLADLIPVAAAGIETRRGACRAPLATAMAEWERFSQGSAIALMRFHDVAQLLVASARDSHDDELTRLAEAIAGFAAWLRQQPERADAALMLEVAEALVLVEDALEQEGARGPADAQLFAADVEAAIAHLARLRETGPLAAAPARQRWRERRLVAQAVGEILANFDAVEAVLEAYFKAPANADALPAALALLHQAHGALQLLGEADAAGLGAQIEARLAACSAAAPSANDCAAIADRLAALAQFVRSLFSSQPERALLAATVSPAPTFVPETAAPAADTADTTDTVDPQLAALFIEEADDELAQLEENMRAWRATPDQADIGRRLARLLHTFKGSARMCGALSIGEHAHGMEARIEQALLDGGASPALLDELDAALDHANRQVAALRASTAAAQPAAEMAAGPAGEAAPAVQLRVRADLIDELVTEAGEMAIARSRIDGGVKAMKAALLDLNDNVARLRGQLREFEIIAETGMQSRCGSGGQEAEFDPLELDRFTRLQELARLMTESVGDVALVQHTLVRQADEAGTALAAQLRQNRAIAHALLRARLVPFSSVAERLHRVVRQTARELGKQAELAIAGGDTPVDRNVLERMLAPLEHLLRNAVAHGIETVGQRRDAGKPAAGRIALAIAAGENDIRLTLADDGQGLDLAAIRQRAGAHGLLDAATTLDDAALAELIFRPGFSTAATVSEIAGRGVGLDVVRNEVDQLGGRIAVDGATGQGTRFAITLPLTLAVIPVMLVRAAGQAWAIPAALVEAAQELGADELAARRAAGAVMRDGLRYPWHALAALYRLPREEHQAGWQLLVRSGGQQIALEVESLAQNQEVVVKPVGEMLARVPGLTGATVLPDGSVALIVNPVTLALRTRAPGAIGNTTGSTAAAGSVPPAPTFPPQAVPAVMVVDDSLTVRKITGRLLERAGYRVMLAKDGVDALEQLAAALPAALPAVILADIEMPRMDGFELVRALRADPCLAALSVIMISSRSAERHRQVARALGVCHYLGKPYDEADLLDRVAGLLIAQETTTDA